MLILHFTSSSSAATGGSSTDTTSPASPGDTGAGDAGGTGTGSPVTPNGAGDQGGGSGSTDNSGGNFDTGGSSYDNSGSYTGGNPDGTVTVQYNASGVPVYSGSGFRSPSGVGSIVSLPSYATQSPAALAIAQTLYQQPNQSTVTYNTVQRTSPNVPIFQPTASAPAPAPSAPQTSGTVSKGFAG